MEGAIRFEQTEEGVRVSYHERGGNGHSGVTAGIVRWNGRKGVFTAVWGNSPDAEKGKLSFDLENGLLRVESEGTISQYAGTRVVFKGEFTRVAPLSAKDRDMIASEISFYAPK